MDPGEQMLRRLAGFTATLRANGFAVGLAEAEDGARILASPLAARPELLEPALRALVCSRAEEWRQFDEIFAAWWQGHGIRRAALRTNAPLHQGPRTLRQLGGEGQPHGAHQVPNARPGEEENDAQGSGRREGASRAESFARTDFRHLSDPDALAAAHAAAARLAARLRPRQTRRMRAARHGRRLDMRRTIRASIPHGGTPLDLVWRRRRTEPLKLVVLLDVSGSMGLYTAVFTRFIHGVVRQFRTAHAFLFHTRLVQISEALRDRDPQRALDRLSLLGQGAGGGTRIGDCLTQFARLHARRVLTGRCVLIIVSDGYDTGEPGVLGAAMAALRRRCKRIIWLNPMLGWPGYTPVARGMAEALPHLDLFAPAHDLESLNRLERHLARL